MPAGGFYYDQPVAGVLWAALAEKAYAEANGTGWVTTSDSYNNSYSALDGGWPSWALAALTGSYAGVFNQPAHDAGGHFQAGQPVVLCTDSPSSPLIVGSHAYAVVGYDPSSSTPFRVYNPWGTDASGMAPSLYNGHQVYGLFSQDATFISQNFSQYGTTYAALHNVMAHPDAGPWLEMSPPPAPQPVSTDSPSPAPPTLSAVEHAAVFSSAPTRSLQSLGTVRSAASEELNDWELVDRLFSPKGPGLGVGWLLAADLT